MIMKKDFFEGVLESGFTLGPRFHSGCVVTQHSTETADRTKLNCDGFMLSAANNSLHKTHCNCSLERPVCKARLLACVVLSIVQFPQKYETAQLFLKIIINEKCFLSSNQHIRMISEGSCDIEDWSNDAENTALAHRNKLHFKVYCKQLF